MPRPPVTVQRLEGASVLHVPARVFEAETVRVQSHLASLSPIEQQVVLLSLGDTRETVGDGLEFRRIRSRLFGMRPSNRLANPRLEALCVFCVRYRLNQGLPGREARDVVLSLETVLAAAALIDSRLPRSSPSSEAPLTRARRRFFPRI